jgi:hypothetical protein
MRTIKVLLTVVAGLLLAAIAIWKWRLLPGSVVFFVILTLMLCSAGRWRQVFTTVDGTIWWGGLLMWFSAFPRYAYGPMGVELTQADRLRNVDLSWVGIWWLILSSGIFWGATVATLAAISIAADSTRFISKLRYFAVAIWLVTVSTGSNIVIWKLSDGARGVVALVISAATIIALAIVVRCDWLPTAKVTAVHIVGGLSLLFGLVPIWDPGGSSPDLAIYGMGFWMYCAGVILVIAASAWALKKAPIARSTLAQNQPTSDHGELSHPGEHGSC